MNDTTPENEPTTTDDATEISADGAEATHSEPAPPPEGAAKADPEGAESAPKGDAEAGNGAEEAEAAPPPPTLEEQLEASQAATKAMKEKMLRVAADFENYRRRANKEVDDARARGKQTAVKDLLPVFDNLERATAHVDDNTAVKTILDGLRMVHKQFIDVLGKMGMERVPSVGSGFDPSIHESIQYEHSDEHPAGVVMTELQPGYKQGDALVRPALVVVSRGPAEEAPPAEPTDEGAAAEEPATGSSPPADEPS